MDTKPTRPGEELDADTLRQWLERQDPGFTGPLQITQFSGGASNLSYVNGQTANKRFAQFGQIVTVLCRHSERVIQSGTF